jgi:Autophagy protein ATG9
LRVKAQQSVSQFIEQTSHELRRIGCILRDAALDSYREQRQQQHLRERDRLGDGLLRRPTPSRHAWWGSSGDSTQRQQQNAYFEEFGLPDPSHQDPHHTYQLAEEDAPANGNHPNEYIHLNVRFRPENEGWASVSNLDLYFQSLYSYFYNRGLVPICTRGIVELITLYFTLFLSIVLFVFIDWHALSQCTDEHTCLNDFKSYIRTQPFTEWSLWNTWIILYGLIFCMYSIMATLSFVHTVQNAINTRWVYEERLGISARKLMGGAVDWDRDVVQKLIQLQESGEYRIIIPQSNAATGNGDAHRRHNQHPLDALMIANRILRKENFMVALFNRNVLDLSVPMNLFSSSSRSGQAPTFFCSSLEVREQNVERHFSFRFCSQLVLVFAVERVLLCAEFHVQSQVSSPSGFLFRPGGIASALSSVWNSTCHLYAVFVILCDLILWFTKCIRLEIDEAIFRASRMVHVCQVDVS